MYKNKILSYILLLVVLISLIAPLSITNAASLDNVLTTLATSTTASQNSTQGGTGLFEKLFGFVFDKLLSPILNVFNGKASTNSPTTQPGVIAPLLPTKTPISSQPTQNDGVLKGKIIVVDPGHGGSNPGAVANSTRESDNNLAVSLKLRDKLVQAGAKVIMTRDTDRTVAAEGSSLSEELEARVNLAETNHADMFISIHSNENSDPNIAGAMTFYPNGKSSTLASQVETALVAQTSAENKGTSDATFYVLRNTSMPSILVEMGFVSNKEEAALLNNDSYRTKVAQGILNGIVNYSN